MNEILDLSQANATSKSLDSFERCLDGWNRLSLQRGVESGNAVVSLDSGARQQDCEGVRIGAEYFQERKQILVELGHARADVARLEAKFEAHVVNERCMVAAELRRLAKQFSLDARDIFPEQSETVSPTRLSAQPTTDFGQADNRAHTYRSPDGQVWLGKGRYPRWLKEALAAGRSLEDFVIQ